MESVWTSLVGPLIATQSGIHPASMMPGGDYSSYDRFSAPLQPGRSQEDGHYYTDMRKVLEGDSAFVQSTTDLGVQMADILAAILTRALNGKLREDGWGAMGPLFVKHPAMTVHVIALSGGTEPAYSKSVTDQTWVSVLRAIEDTARPMLTPSTLKLVSPSGA